MKKFLLALALALTPATASAQCTGIFQPGSVCGVGAVESARPPHSIPLGSTVSLVVGTTGITSGTSLGLLFNNAGVLGNTNSVSGALLNTDTSANPLLTRTPILGINGTATGTLGFRGLTSGTATITPQAAAGTPTLTLPNTSGTIPSTASSPLVLNATTGALTCPTCATSSGGGAITGTAPINVTAAGVVSLQGADGTLAQGTAGTGSTFTATPTLGVAGSTVGSLAFANATSGSVTINTVAGALGARTISLPAASGTFAVSATSPITLSAAGDIGLTTPLALNFGGTNANLTASNGGLVYSDASKMQILAGTATAGQIPRSGTSSAPSWSTATYPNNAAANSILVAATTDTITASQTPVLGTNGGTGGSLTLNGATSGSSVIKVNTAAGTGTNFQLPASNGISGQVLQTDGSGNTSWAAAAGGGTVTSVTIAGTTGQIAVSGTCTITSSGTCTIDLPAARKTNPTTQVFTTGSGTYTTPANVLWIEIEMCGGGGGGAGSGTTPGNGGNGGDTTFSTFTAAKGSGATGATGGAGGTGTGGYLNQTGGDGGNGSGATTANPGGQGGGSAYGGAGAGGASGAAAGKAGATNSCSGGGGGSVNTTPNGGGGGGAGGFVKAIIGAPAATYSYAVGAAGTAGTAGTSGAAGGAGAAGRIAVVEHYN